MTDLKKFSFFKLCREIYEELNKRTLEKIKDVFPEVGTLREFLETVTADQLEIIIEIAEDIADKLSAEYSEKTGFDIQIDLEGDEAIKISINDLIVDVSKSALDSGELDAYICDFSEKEGNSDA